MNTKYTPMNIRCPTDLVFSRVTDPSGKLFMPWQSTLTRDVMVDRVSDPENPLEGVVEAVIGHDLVVVANQNGYSRREIVCQTDIYYAFAKQIVTTEQLEHWHNRRYMITRGGWVGRSGRLAPPK